MIIRLMEDKDVSAVAFLEKSIFADPWSENSIRSSFESRLSTWVVAEEQGSIVGYVGSEAVLDSADMMNIAVAVDFRRRGIAEKLVVALSECLQKKNVKYLMLEVRVSNTPAIALYEKLAFTVAGRRPRYYTNPREDAYVMRKELIG